MTWLKFSVRNKDRLAKKLRRLAPAAAIEIEKANGNTAREMVALAQSYVPVHTGRLKESIVATPPDALPPKYAQGSIFNRSASAAGSGSWLVTAGNPGVRYAHLVEFGSKPHKNRGTFAGTDNPGAPPQPYFFPAYRIVRKKHRSRATRAINKAIKDVAKK